MARFLHSDVEQLAQRIRQADAVLIGGGSGLSSAAGYDHYHWSGILAERLAPFREYYGFPSPFAGFYHCFSSYGEQWGYYSQYIRAMWEVPTGQPYLDLRQVIGDKPFFVLTTNVDGQFFRVFGREKVCAFQGDFGSCQCSQPCLDEVWENRAMIRKLTRHLDGVRLPEEVVPRCPACGRILVPWVRDDAFLEGSTWRQGVERYRNFLRHWLMEQKGKRVLLLELGVGEMTPSIIKLPFWRITAQNEQVFYACLNRKSSHAPAHLAGRSLYVQGELDEVLGELQKCLAGTEDKEE